MIENDDLYNRLEEMSEEDMVNNLDPICYALRGKVKLDSGIEVLSNRILSLAVLDLYKQWQEEQYNRD